jgi:hypothetical protein
LQLAETIHHRHQEEEKQKEFVFWKAVIPCVINLQTANFLFPAIEALVKKYLPIHYITFKFKKSIKVFTIVANDLS